MNSVIFVGMDVHKTPLAFVLTIPKLTFCLTKQSSKMTSN